MAPSTPHPMSSYEARKASFISTEANAGPSKRKGASTSKSSWPHQTLTSRGKGNSGAGSSDEGVQSGKPSKSDFPSPRSMANLGLYYDPTPECDDRCTIYPDGHVISGWRAGQSAFERLQEEDISISWVMIEASKQASIRKEGIENGMLEWQRSEERVLPTGKPMIDARLRTYGGAWPLDRKKGWKPTSKKLSSVGFHFTPNDEENDCVTCAYCQCSLGGWEKTDDPVKEHQKRRPKCPIFTSVLKQQEEEDEKENKVDVPEPDSRKTSSNVSKGRTGTKKRPAEVDDDAFASITSLARPEKRRSPSPQVAEPVEAEAPKLKTSSAKKIKAKAPVKAAQRSTRKKATTSAPEEKEEEEEVAPTTIKPKKRTNKKPAATSKARSPKEDEIEEGKNDRKGAIVKEAQVIDHDEELPTTHDRARDKDTATAGRRPTDSPPTSCESESFKTPKQTASGRTTTQKTPMASSPTPAVTSSIAGRCDIAALEELDPITNVEKSMTVESWLRSHIGKACLEMESEGNRRIGKLREEMDRGRAQAERILRGIDVNLART